MSGSILEYQCPLCDLWTRAADYNEHFKDLHPDRRKKPKARRTRVIHEEAGRSHSVRGSQGGLPSLGKRR
jgi:hypothetical protein